MSATRPPLSRSEVEAFHAKLSNWGRWGEDDQLGTLNLITPAKRAASAARVRSGRTVCCARPLPTDPAPDNPKPVLHMMIGTHGEGWGADYFALAPHGMATSHIDALCHIFHDGKLYNGYSTERVTAHGALELAIDALRDGVVSRGILLDIPRLRGVEYLGPVEPVYPEDLEAAERAGGVQVEEGDILLVRTGRWKERAANGPRADHQLAGLDARCLPWLHERGVAALGGDGVSDIVPSPVEGCPLPIHTGAIVDMGLHLIDNLDLDPLAEACREEGRIEFHLTIAPLVLAGGTASPVNPIALF